MKGSTKLYLIGLTMVVLGGAALADNICESVGSFPISATVFGLGFVLILGSYRT